MSDFRERYEQWKKTGSWGDTSAVSSFRANYYNKKAETAAADIESRVNTWLENNKNFIDNYNYRYGSGNENYRADSAEWLSTVTAQKANFDAEAENIKTLLGHYKDYLNEDYVSEITNALDGNGRLQAQIVSASESDGKYWAQWGSEDEYNSWLQQREEIESILNADDFEEYFSAGESKKEREKWWKGIENNVAYLRDPANLELYESSANSANGASWGTVENTLLDKLDYKAAKYMKDDEYIFTGLLTVSVAISITSDVSFARVMYTVFKLIILLYRMALGYEIGAKAFNTVEAKQFKVKSNYIRQYIRFVEEKTYLKLGDKYGDIRCFVKDEDLTASVFEEKTPDLTA